MFQSYVPTYTAVKKIATSRPSNKEDHFQGVPWDTNTSTMAKGLKSSMENFNFIVSLVVTKEIFAYISSITTGLQGYILIQIVNKFNPVLSKIGD